MNVNQKTVAGSQAKTEGTPWCYHSNVLPKCKVKDADKKDCGYYGIKKDECESKGCCWHPFPDPNPKRKPWCYYSNGDEKVPFGPSGPM